MLYKYITENYKEAEPIFFSDINVEGISKPALNKQLATLCKNGKLAKYDKGIYYLPKKTAMRSTVGPSADMVARYRFVIRKGEIVGYYTGNAFANQIGISTQVPRVVEIVSNNTNSSPREIEIGNRIFYVRKPIEDINGENVYVLQMLDLLKDLDDYLDYGYEVARKRFYDYIHKHGIKRMDVDKYIRKFPTRIFKNFYELEMDHVLTY